MTLEDLTEKKQSNVTKHVCEDILINTRYDNPADPDHGKFIDRTQWDRDEDAPGGPGCCPRVEGCCKEIHMEVGPDGELVEAFRKSDEGKTKEECDLIANNSPFINTIWNKGECREFGFCCECLRDENQQCINPID